MPIRVIHIGLGPIGAGVVRQVASRKGFLIVGAVDIDPAKAGKDLGEVCAVGRKLNVKVADDITKTIKASRPDVAVLCTSSSLKKVVPEFEAVLKLKVPIVSTTEELAYPVKSNARGGEEDRRARQAQPRRRARHRRQSRVSDGRAADRADGRLRERAGDRSGPRAGRARPPAAVPEENRRGRHARAVHGPRQGRLASATSGSPSRSR